MADQPTNEETTEVAASSAEQETYTITQPGGVEVTYPADDLAPLRAEYERVVGKSPGNMGLDKLRQAIDDAQQTADKE
jgi:hypothetical protein